MSKQMDKLKAGGFFTIEHYRDGKLLDVWEAQNIVTNEGLNYLLNAALANGSQTTSHYIGLFKSDYTPSSGDTLAAPGFTEAVPVTDYDEAARQIWDYADGGAASQQITNGSGTGATKATFNLAASNTIFGAFLCSVASGSVGVLVASSRFSAGRAVVDNDQLVITYTIQAASS